MTKETAVTLKTLSKSLGLSVTTVSRALKDGAEVKPETKAVVKEAAERLGYKPNLGGLKLKTGKSYAVCAALSTWSVGDLGDAGSVALMQGMQSTLNSTPYSLISTQIDTGEGALAALDTLVSQKQADGIILDHIQPQDIRVKFLLERNFPFVTFGRTELFSPHAYFDVDEHKAAYDATRFLVEKGHRTIALFCATEKYTFVQHRLRGYRQALEEYGIPFDEDIVYCADIDAAELRAVALKMFSPGAKTGSASATAPSAILSPTEVATVGICAGLRDAGMQIGKDVEVVSRDVSNLGHYLDPPLSAHFHSHAYAGQRLAEFLLRAIDGEDPESLQELHEPRFIERGL